MVADTVLLNRPLIIKIWTKDGLREAFPETVEMTKGSVFHVFSQLILEIKTLIQVMNSYFLFISFQSCDYLRKKVSVCCQYVVFWCLFLAIPVPPTPFYLKINLIEVNLQKTNCTNIKCEFDDCVYTHNHQHSQGRCPSCPLPPGLVNPSLCIWPWETTDPFLSL